MSNQKLRIAGIAAAVTGLLALLPVARGSAVVPDTATARAAGLPDSCTTQVDAPTVFTDDFEGSAPDFGFVKHRYDGLYGNGTITAASTPALNGQQSGEFMVPGDGASWRAEVANDALGYGAYRFRFSDYLPDDWEVSNYDTLLAQWHGKPLSDGSNTNPPIALSVRNSTWLLSVFWLENPTDTTPTRKGYELGPVTLGQWNNWTFDIDWSTPTHPGHIRVCLNGHQLVSHDGPNNYHQPDEPYFKAGIYRPAWNPAKGNTYPPGSVVRVYDDVFRVQKLSD